MGMRICDHPQVLRGGKIIDTPTIPGWCPIRKEKPGQDITENAQDKKPTRQEKDMT
jgi:hypothetical protein